MSGDNGDRNVRGGEEHVRGRYLPKKACADCGGVTGNVVETNRGQVVYADRLTGDVNFFCECSQDPHSDDIALLRSATDANLRLMAEHLSLPSSQGGTAIDRSVFPDLVRANGDFLVTGDPGIGKTALMHRLAQHYRDRGHDVVLFDAASVEKQTIDKLTRSLHTVLTEWEGEEPGHLLIDALDGERGDMLAWLADTVELLGGTRWRTVASARRFDIANNRRWRKAFTGKPVTSALRHQAEELSGVRHFLVDGFNAGELARAGAELPGLDRVLAEADTPLRVLLSNPFNLSLACVLLRSSAWPGEWSDRPDQVALLESYWHMRAVDDNRLARTRLLGELCQLMLDRHSLQVGCEDVSAEHDEAVNELVTAGVLRQIESHYVAALPSLAFTHHIFFDYAVSQLVFVREGRSALVNRLNEHPNLVFAARPSIDLHLAQTWRRDSERGDFASLCWGLARSQSVLAGIAAASTAVSRARTEKDVDWLTSALTGEDDCAAREVVGWVIGVLGGAEEWNTEVRRAAVSVWIPVANALAARLRRAFHPETAELLHRLLRKLDKLDPLGPGAVRAHDRAACVAAMTVTGLEDTAARAGLVAAVALYLPAAVAIDGGHGVLVRRSVRDTHTRKRNPEFFRRCVSGAVDIARGAPDVAVELLETVWELAGDPNEKTPMSTGVVPLNSDMRQDFDGVKYQVGKVFSEAIPHIGVEAACRVLAASTNEPYFSKVAESGSYRLRAEGEEGYVAFTLASLRHAGGHGAPEKMLDALLDWTGKTGPDGVRVTVRYLVRHVRHPDAWTRVLERARTHVVRWRSVLVGLLSSGALIANTVTRKAAAESLGALSPLADAGEHGQLEHAVLAAARSADPDGGKLAARVLDEIVPYLDAERLTQSSLIEHKRSVDQLDEPPEVSFSRITAGTRELTREERFGQDLCAELDKGRMALIERLDELSKQTGNATDEQSEELAELFLAAARDQVFLERISPIQDDRAAELVVRAAQKLARLRSASPETELGRRVYRVLRQAVGHSTDTEGEKP
ncbi:hypothetical protein ABZ512_08785 [Nocardiopsis dassonvillei]|uniref:hypothetical protein n=1 Tax=Nocardiopsis dassonvillei TaxID=2014 RepID=UPI0033FFF5D5